MGMTAMQIFYWVLSCAGAAALAAALTAWLKSYAVTHPPRRRTPVVYQPEQYGLAYEAIDFAAADGVPLKGWFIPAAGGGAERTIILCHGSGANRGELMRDTHFLAGRGFNLFYFDFRGSGDSGGSVSSLGYLETRDFDAAYEFLKNRRPYACEQVGLFGVSMGGSVAIYSAAKYPEFKCLLCENVFLSYRRVVANFGRLRMRLPYWPLVPMTLFFVRLKLGADPEPFSPSYNIGKVKIPVMFINGDRDDLVPMPDAERLYRLCGSGKKQMWTVTGASHGKCAEVGGEIYKNKVSTFFLENM